MPTNHFAVAAVPATGATAPLRSGLVSRYAYCLTDAESAADFVAIDPSTGDVCPALIQGGVLYGLDNTDTTTAAGPTCLVSFDSKRYKLNTLATPFSVLDKDLTVAPVTPTIGDAYLIFGAPSGTWAGKSGNIAIYTSLGWKYMLPPIGFRVLVEDENAYYFRDASATWQAGLGSVVVPANSIPLSAEIGAGASGMRKVINQTTYAPPGSRKTGATPAVPLGGTAANINDNNDTTTSVTSALGDLSSAAFASRIIAQLTLAATTDLICIEARGVLGTTVSSSNAMGLWYKSGGIWTQAGAGFTLSATAQNVQRTGTFAAVTDIALVTEAKNWSTNTNTLAGLNAYDATVTAAVGDAYIIAANSFGIWAGDSTKVAVCELANSFTIYAPQDGDRLYDIAQGTEYRWSATQVAWLPSAGVWIDYKEVVANGAIIVTAVGTNAYGYSSTTPPLNTQRAYTDPGTLSFTAKKAGNRLRFRYSAEVDWAAFDSGSSTNVTSDQYADLAIFRDAESNAIAWARIALPANLINGNLERELFSSALDTATHTYQIYFMTGWGNDSIGPGHDAVWYPFTVMNTRFSLEEKAP